MRSTMGGIKAKPKRRSGVVAVEMALVMPIALTLIFGIMQVGYAFMIQHMLQDAARKGCRAASFPSSSNTVVTSAVNGVLSNMKLTGVTTTILVNGAAVDVSTASYGSTVSVSVQIPLSNVMLFSVSFAQFTGTIQGAATIRCE